MALLAPLQTRAGCGGSLANRPQRPAAAPAAAAATTAPASALLRACSLQQQQMQQHLTTSTTSSSSSSRGRRCTVAAAAAAAPEAASAGDVHPEAAVPGMSAYLDSLRWDSAGLVPVIVQHVDTGELLMQAYADRAAICETLQTKVATFYSRSRQQRWCKGETSGNFIRVAQVFQDCDRDSLIYLGDPIGPTCHTGARTCWFHEARLTPDAAVATEGAPEQHDQHAPLTTLLALEATIKQRRRDMEQQTEGKPSWTAKLLSNPELLCKKVREEAGELCQTLEANEGQERAASEMADLLYHAMVLMNVQGVPMEDVLRVLRQRFGTSGIAEKAARPPKQA